MANSKDPIGAAILDFSKNKTGDNITVHSDLCDDDILPTAYLFRTYNEMPEVEQKALDLCQGEVLEVGAGTGCHAKYLMQNNFKTFSIDTSNGSVDYMKSQNIPCQNISFLEYHNAHFDTVLILMNGLGIAGKLKNISAFLAHAKSLLNENGIILADSSDIRYLYDDNDGGKWVEFQMEYKQHKSDWFPWVYIDFETLKNEAKKVGLKATKLFENENFHYLTKLEII